jgi:hypothetical protein
MKDNPRITYLLGAGASWFSCPILKEQGEKMIELAKAYFKNPDMTFDIKPSEQSNNDEIMWDIGYFGSISLKYGTIDTYAKKLNLNNSVSELTRLKLSVSIFFTIWQLTDDKTLKCRDNIVLDDIDRRYISLMASIIQAKNHNRNQIKENIRFVTWNYDLQLEFAFKSFCNDTMNWKNISNDLKFRIDEENTAQLEICHLNGYHGFYKTKSKEHDILDLPKSRNINDIISEISYLSESQERGTIDVTNHINYAWEENKLAKKSRLEATRIFQQTDILIIIGYSFPNFNKEIDKILFNELKGRKTKIYFQDPNASREFLNQLVDSNDCEIICQNKKLDNFILPYEF